MEIASTSGIIDTSATTQSSALGALDGNAFLTLLVTQLQNQDPLNPMDNQEFISQMAQLTSLEELHSLNESASQAGAIEQLSMAASLVGRQVEWSDADGTLHQGIVGEAIHSSDGTSLLVGDTRVALASVTRVVGNTQTAE